MKRIFGSAIVMLSLTAMAGVIIQGGDKVVWNFLVTIVLLCVGLALREI
jgi:hypothetical protein